MVVGLKAVVAAELKAAAAELQVVAAAECLTEECVVEEHLMGPTVEWSHWQVVVKLIVIVSANVSHCEGPCVPVEAPNVLRALLQRAHHWGRRLCWQYIQPPWMMGWYRCG